MMYYIFLIKSIGTLLEQTIFIRVMTYYIVGFLQKAPLSTQFSHQSKKVFLSNGCLPFLLGKVRCWVFNSIFYIFNFIFLIATANAFTKSVVPKTSVPPKRKLSTSIHKKGTLLHISTTIPHDYHKRHFYYNSSAK